MGKKKILIIDDEKEVARMAKLSIAELGRYDVQIETNALEAFSTIGRFKPDLILLDFVMPGISGLEICKKLKGNEKFSSIPIIMLSGQNDECHKVSCLENGADDYIVKPFSLNELDARIKAILRRTDAEDEDSEIKVGKIITINIEKHQVMVKKNIIDLTSAEFTILKILASHQTHVFSRAKILEALWDSPGSVTERTIDVHINHLRKKLGEAAECIKNVRGIGYKLDEK